MPVSFAQTCSLGKGAIVVERPRVVAADPAAFDLLTARAALKAAAQSRDAARSAHVAAQRSVDELRELVHRLEVASRTGSLT